MEKGETLARVRKYAKVSMMEILRGCGVDPSGISNIEHGKRQPSLETAIRLSLFFGMPIEELFPECVPDDVIPYERKKEDAKENR